MKTIFKREFNTKLGIICMWIETSLNSNLAERDVFSVKTECHKVFIQEFKLQKEWIHNEMKIDSSIGWRIFIEKESENNEDLVFYCKLINPINTIGASPDSGEWLDAIKIEDKKEQLHIGTEDGEMMLSRAEASDWMPNRLKNKISILNSITEYIDFGFKTKIPTLSKGEKLYTHFIIATKSKNDSSDVATWFAVDQAKNFLDEKLRY